MNENDKIHLDELQRTYERAYRRGYYDGIQFILDSLKDEKLLKVFKDGNIFR